MSSSSSGDGFQAPPHASGDLKRLTIADRHFDRARTCLRQTLNRYSQQWLGQRQAASTELRASVKTELRQLSASLDKLNAKLVRIAVFGLVSRGKSSVLNALIGQPFLPTGPTHGVTQWTRSLCWSLNTAEGAIPVELIDTPGLDEIDGQARADLAKEVATQADLILFVVAGDITRTEYRALRDLQQHQKPLVVVFNKADLYPDRDRQAIYNTLQTLWANEESALDSSRWSLRPDNIVLVAAEPAPVEVRVEYPDGRVSQEWETPAPQIQELKTVLLRILNQEGQSLLALNALRQAQDTEAAIARATLHHNQDAAEALIWKFARWKAIAIAANPVAVLDLMGGAVTDLVMIRSLARLYGLPMTRHEASKLLKAILWSSGGLLLGEWGSGVLLGVGKSGAAIASLFDGSAGLTAYTTAAIAQASLAGYGSYRVGKAAQIYLQQGCTWGPQGASTVIQDLLATVEQDSILARLRQDLQVSSTESHSDG